MVPLLVAPVLWFPRVGWMVLGLTVPAIWVGNCWFKKHFVASTPLNLLLFSLLIMVLVSLHAMFDVEFSLAKVAGTLLGVFVFFGLVRFIDRGPRLWLGISGQSLFRRSCFRIGESGCDQLENSPQDRLSSRSEPDVSDPVSRTTGARRRL